MFSSMESIDTINISRELHSRQLTEAMADQVTIVIRLGQGDDVELRRTREQLSHTTLSDLRRLVRQERGGGTLNRRLRFVYQGQVVRETADLARDVVGSQSKVFLLCSVGAIMTAEEQRRGEDEESRPPPPLQTHTTEPEPRGFDRLRGAGLPEEDIQRLRRQFGELYGFGDQNQLDQLDQIEREEQWLEQGVVDPDSAPSDDLQPLQNGLYLALGAFGGIWAIVAIKVIGLDWHHVKFVTLGMGINLALTVLRALA